ncbi:hypothetical protein PT974_01538 [Cladobotryum mycophilum]|uniref:Uncharacterized protein n=1 Tax=Cladobotryum mycophilum TaxID=491253 RepID=A0ABR0T416_9HYPO
MRSTLPLTIFGFVSTALAGALANCRGGPFSNECVFVYGGTGCEGYNLETSYRPTCEGNCYAYPFGSISVQASEFYNVDCHAYSDDNCQNEIGDTGNVNGGCYNFSNGRSMKCYYHC